MSVREYLTKAMVLLSIGPFDFAILSIYIREDQQEYEFDYLVSTIYRYRNQKSTIYRGFLRRVT